ncbi:MAG: hypothetical protein LC104_06770 [Bacteroidales bacterium]|nr:hypothetical protein [Bacteroidales bacterium]
MLNPRQREDAVAILTRLRAASALLEYLALRPYGTKMRMVVRPDEIEGLYRDLCHQIDRIEKDLYPRLAKGD